jgi:hypothetical protein
MDTFGRRTARPMMPEPSAEKSGSERRWAHRRPGNTPALIYIEGMNSSIPCIIRDTSTTGARLELQPGWSNPLSSGVSKLDRLRLVIRHDRVMYDCQIMRRGENELGVKFLSAPRPLMKAPRQQQN